VVAWPKSLDWWNENDFWCIGDIQLEASLCIAIALAEDRVERVQLVEETWFEVASLEYGVDIKW